LLSQKLLYPIIALALVTHVAVVLHGIDPLGRPREGGRAPNFSATLLNGSSFRLADTLVGHRVLLTFWTTWCVPCIQEFAELRAVLPELTKRDVVVVAVNTGEQRTTVAEAVRRRDYGFIDALILDPDGDVASSYVVDGYPTTFLIDSSGRIIRTRRGYDSGAVRQLLASLNGG
jgi:peroxiredoxin